MTTNTREPNYWTYVTNDQYRAFSPVKPPDNAYAGGTLEPLYTDYPTITHCDNCGSDWLDNGLNPVGCPYCKQLELTEALELMVEMVEMNGFGRDYALDVARAALRNQKEESK